MTHYNLFDMITDNPCTDSHKILTGPSFTHNVKSGTPLVKLVESELIAAALRATDGSTGKASRILGISVRKIQYWLRDHNLRSSDFSTKPTVVGSEHLSAA